MANKNSEFAFPYASGGAGREGMSLRDWFATFAPEPPDSWMKMWRQNDRDRNPHNDSYKPKIRSDEELRATYKYQYADAMIAARDTNDR